MRAGQDKHRLLLQPQQVIQSDGFRFLSAHHIHHAEVFQIHGRGKVAHTGDERDGERRDFRKDLLAHRVFQILRRCRRRYMRDFEQAHVACNHAVGDAAAHVARFKPVPAEQLRDALCKRRFQIAVVSVYCGMANAAVPRYAVQRFALVAEQRHAQVRRSAVNNENHFAASHSAIACVNAFARASTAA